MRGQTRQHSGLPGLRLDWGLMTLSSKKFTVAETKSIDNTTQTGETAVVAQMMLLGQRRREADRSHSRPKQDNTKTRQDFIFIYTTHTKKDIKKDNTNCV